MKNSEKIYFSNIFDAIHFKLAFDIDSDILYDNDYYIEVDKNELMDKYADKYDTDTFDDLITYMMYDIDYTTYEDLLLLYGASKISPIIEDLSNRYPNIQHI